MFDLIRFWSTGTRAAKDFLSPVGADWMNDGAWVSADDPFYAYENCVFGGTVAWRSRSRLGTKL